MRRLLFLFSMLAIVSCSMDRVVHSFSIVTHNAYCFFDSYECGEEFDGFKARDGYDAECYEKRISNYAKFILNNMRDADVILFQEVENSSVLEDLLEAGLKRKGYLYYGSAAVEDGVLSTGFISKEKPNEVLFHGLSGSRLIMELVFDIDGERIHILNIHGSSRLSEANANKRMEEFSLLRSILSSNSGELSIVMGDFNVDLKTGEESIALKGTVESLNSPISISGDGGELRDGIYYCPWVDNMESLGKGTYFYSGAWSALDGTLLTEEAFDWQGAEYESSRVIEAYESMDSIGKPMPFSPASQTGFSDHLPFQVTIRFKN